MTTQRITGFAPEHICELIQKGYSGCVEMVNSRGIYLQLESKHILLCNANYGTVPNGVSVEDWERVPALLAIGQPVRSENNTLYFPAVSLELELRSVPKDTRILHPDEKALHAGIDVLRAEAKPTGLTSLVHPLFSREIPKMNLYCEMALVHVRGLLRALKENDAAGIFQSVSFLLGLGPGLTPSGDDLLSGLVYGLRHSALRDTDACISLTNAIRELAKDRTNAVSTDYLLAISEDAPFDRMAAAWADPANGAADLLRIGSNSGGEMFLGLLCAANLQNLS